MWRNYFLLRVAQKSHALSTSWCSSVDGASDPIRWRQSWWDSFMKCHPQFRYRTWSKKQLQGQPWFCANLYIEPLSDYAATLLMLEIVFNEGGYYAPLSTTFAGIGQGQDP